MVFPPHETPEIPTTIFCLGEKGRMSFGSGGWIPAIGFKILTSARNVSRQVIFILEISLFTGSALSVSPFGLRPFFFHERFDDSVN